MASGLSQGSIYALLGLGFSLVYLSSGVLNVMQGGYALIAAYLHIVLTPLIGMPAAFAAAVAFAGLMGLLTERIVNLPAKPWKPVPHITAVLVTLALLVAVEGLALLVWGADPKMGHPIQRGFVRFAGAIIPKQSFWNLGVAVFATIALSMFLNRTWMGRVMRANHDNGLMCHLIGANVRTVSAVAFTLAAVLGAMAGILSSPVVWVEPAVGGTFMLYGILAFLIGGVDRIWGPLLGGLLLGVGENLFLLIPGLTGGLLKQVMPMFVLLLMLVVMPQGLLGGRASTAARAQRGQ